MPRCNTKGINITTSSVYSQSIRTKSEQLATNRIQIFGRNLNFSFIRKVLAFCIFSPKMAKFSLLSSKWPNFPFFDKNDQIFAFPPPIKTQVFPKLTKSVIFEFQLEKVIYRGFSM